MPDIAEAKPIRQRNVTQLAVGALSLAAGIYAAACVIRSLLLPPVPLEAPPQGPLAGLLTLHLAPPLWRVLLRVAAAVAAAGLVATGLGLLGASRRLLTIGLWGLLPECALKTLLVPGRLALLVYPAGIRLDMSGLDPSTRYLAHRLNVFFAALFIVCAVAYVLYVLWLRRQLQKMRA